jgi:hypothetical protein
MHLIWLSLVLPPMGFAVWAFPKTRRPDLWLFCLQICLIALAAWTGWRLLSSVGLMEVNFQRIMFALITSFELPIVALALGCAGNWLAAMIFPAKIDLKLDA